MSESAGSGTGKQSSRRRNAVPTLVDAGCLPAGTEVFLMNLRGEEERWIAPWLAANPSRRRALWLNELQDPLLWAYDGKRYTPTGLSVKIWDLAGWPHNPPTKSGGPWRWVVPGQGSLWDMAMAVQDGQPDRRLRR
jgi:hypothetical protein